jgi:hypothetical protein
MNLQGLVIATAIVGLPQVALGLYMDSNSSKYRQRESRLGRWAAGFTLATIWIFAGPALADWATPDFNIGGLWQYAVLIVVLFALAFALWRLFKLGTHIVARLS